MFLSNLLLSLRSPSSIPPPTNYVPSPPSAWAQSLADPFKVLHPHAAASASLGLEPARRSADDISSRFSDSEAEAAVDPKGDVAKASGGDKGIWIEPGSNKGYDSFALDSLQAPHTPPTSRVNASEKGFVQGS